MLIRVLAAFLLAGCASPAAAPEIRTVPTGRCDARMVDHNRRACLERGGAFITGGAGTCGACVR